MHKRILSTVVAVGIIATMGSTSVFASPVQDAQSKLNASHKNVQNLEDNIEKMDNQIETIMNQRDSVNKKISEAQSNINEAQNDIETSKDNIKEEKDKFADRVRALYISGSTQSYVDILLQSKSFSDMVSRIDAIKQISDYDQKLVSDLKDSQNRIEAKKDKIVADKQQLEALNKENSSKLKELNDKKAQENVLVAQAKAEESKDATALKAQQDAEKAAQAKVLALVSAPKTAAAPKAAAPINRGTASAPAQNRQAPTPSTFQGSGNDVVSFAVSFCGVPYVSGGTSPSGFDCSGLVQYCYAHFGVNLPRTTYDQVNVGTTVTGALQPGDLLFFGSASAPHHVAMYAGGGNMVEAPHTGAFVRVTPVRAYSIAKRVR